MAKSPVYFYPLKEDQAGQKLFFMHQIEGVLQVSSCDRGTGTIERLSSSLDMPTNVSFLPDNSAFSFIDHGSIKLKRLNYRSASRIEPDIPLYTPSSLYWLNSDWSYLSAGYAKRRGIFLLKEDGLVQPILFNAAGDYSYPHCVGGTVFCIRRDVKNGNYAVVSAQLTAFDQRLLKNDIDLSSEQRITFSQKQAAQALYASESQTHDLLIADFGTTPVVFLSMVSCHKGYLLGHTVLDNQDVRFDCYQITEREPYQPWQIAKLFDFCIPMKFFAVDSADCLCEALIPLQPCYTACGIYYVDYDQGSGRLKPFFYDCAQTESVSIDIPLHHCLPPRMGWEQLIFGGSSMNESTSFVFRSPY